LVSGWRRKLKAERSQLRAIAALPGLLQLRYSPLSAGPFESMP
jgi:hypothetical protein